MLGNWSLGDYFKKEQLPWFYLFLVDEVGLDPERLYVTVFAGDNKANVPKDEESAEIWAELFNKKDVSAGVAEIGSEENGYRRGMKDGERIFYYDASKNWWSRAGKPENMPIGEIGGPDSEVFYDFKTEHDIHYGVHCHPNCDCGRFLEIGNSVFMEYKKTAQGFERLPQQNVDFGGGLERITAAKNGDADIFKIDLLHNLIKKVEEFSGKKYGENTEAFRIITDHLRAAVFMLADDVQPSNTEQGYFVRRLLRRAILEMHKLKPDCAIGSLVKITAKLYKDQYPNIYEQIEVITKAVTDEETNFVVTLSRGLKEFERISANGISGYDAFILFTTYGFPYELTEELARGKGMAISRSEFDKEMKKHQETSRVGAEHKFKGGLADNSKKVVMYHTATHLLLAGLRKELGKDVHQAGSNITAERLRFDFTYPEKVEDETLRQIETYVNDAIRSSASVTIETIPKTEAETDPTVEGSFWERYPDEVKVYTIKDATGNVYSRELCGGPHVENTEEIKGVFKITREESIAAGVRRIRAVLE